MDMAIPSMASSCWDVVQARGLLTKPFSRLFTQNLSQASSQVTAKNLMCFSCLQLSRSPRPYVGDAVRAVGATSPEGLTFGSSKSTARPPASNGHWELPSYPWGKRFQEALLEGACRELHSQEDSITVSEGAAQI